jgi:hypothetical protein
VEVLGHSFSKTVDEIKRQDEDSIYSTQGKKKHKNQRTMFLSPHLNWSSVSLRVLDCPLPVCLLLLLGETKSPVRIKSYNSCCALTPSFIKTVPKPLLQLDSTFCSFGSLFTTRLRIGDEAWVENQKSCQNRILLKSCELTPSFFIGLCLPRQRIWLFRFIIEYSCKKYK